MKTLKISGIEIGYSLDTVLSILGSPESVSQDTLTFKLRNSERPLIIRICPSQQIVRYIEGENLSLVSNDADSCQELLLSELGTPPIVLETSELGGRFWGYEEQKLQVWFSPGFTPLFVLANDFEIPDMSIPEEFLDELEDDLWNNQELSWVPNPNAPRDTSNNR